MVYLGIGSNLGDPLNNCCLAVRAIAGDRRNQVIEVSPFYRTEPVGRRDQNWFVNAVVALKTSLEPMELLRFLLTIEREMGRKRKERWGPRVIDLDILFYADRVIQEEDLQIPHPRLHERRFVLAPLNDIAPDWRHPLLDKSVSQLLEVLPEEEKVFPLREEDQKACGGSFSTQSSSE